MSDGFRDAAFAVRSYVRAPTFTAVAVLTLALGIGATTAVFSVVSGVLLRPLPYPDADRLVQIVENVPAQESLSGRALRLTAIDQSEFDFWRTSMTTFEGVAVTLPDPRTVFTPDGTLRLGGAQVSPALFAIRGAQPMLGRSLRAEDERTGSAVVISVGTWRRLYGGASDVVGRALTLDGQPYTIVGVMPPTFGEEAFWTPFRVEPPRPGAVRLVTIVAKLKPGVTLAAANAEAAALGARLRGSTPEAGAPPRFEVVRELDRLVGAVRPALRLLVFAVAAVLLIVCANVANLLLTRGTARHREIAVRRALGAPRGRIVRQLIAEGLVLSVAGGIVGTLIAYQSVALAKQWGVIEIPDQFRLALGPLGPAILPRVDEIELEWGALAFTVAVSIAAGLLFTIAPALRLSRIDHRDAFSTANLATRTAGASTGGRLGRGLAVVQLGLATTLLVGATLLLHSFIKLTDIHLGFDQQARIFQVIAPGEYPRSRKLALAYAVEQRLRRQPGVEAIGFTNTPPLATDSMRGTFLPAEHERERKTLGRGDSSQIRAVSTHYLQALGVRLVDGRWFDEAEDAGRPQVVIVNRAWLQRYSPHRSPVGTTVRTSPTDSWEVIGVVDDVRLRMDDGPDRQPAQELPLVAFVDIRQITASYANGQLDRPRRPDLDALLGGTRGLTFAVRAGQPINVAAVRTALADVNPSLAVEGFATIGDVFGALTARQRFYAMLMAAFGATAALIAAIGIYGVLAYGMTQRTQEFGIRLALGAQPRSVLKLAMRQGVMLVAVGIVAGLVGAIGVTRYLENMLFEVTPLDARTYAMVAIVFGGIGLLACYVPARRATLTSPLEALRHD